MAKRKTPRSSSTGLTWTSRTDQCKYPTTLVSFISVGLGGERFFGEAWISERFHTVQTVTNVHCATASLHFLPCNENRVEFRRKCQFSSGFSGVANFLAVCSQVITYRLSCSTDKELFCAKCCHRLEVLDNRLWDDLFNYSRDKKWWELKNYAKVECRLQFCVENLKNLLGPKQIFTQNLENQLMLPRPKKINDCRTLKTCYLYKVI